MILSVSEQVTVFLWTTVCGMAAAFIYDLFRIFRKAVKTGNLVTFIQDLLYWIIVAVIMSVTIFYSNDGELRGFLFLGTFLGAVLYGLLFSRIIMSSSLLIIRVTVKIIKFVTFVVSYPFKLIIKLLAIPVRKLKKVCVTEIGKAKERSRAYKEKVKEKRRANREKATAKKKSRAKEGQGKAKEGSGRAASGKKKEGRKSENGKRHRKRSILKRFGAVKKDF